MKAQQMKIEMDYFTNRNYKDYVYGRCKYKSTWKNKEYLTGSNRKMIWCIKTNIIAYVKKQKKKIYYPLCQIYSPTVFFFNSISKRWTNMPEVSG